MTRPAVGDDLDAIHRIQSAAPEASQWDPASYLDWDCRVAELSGDVLGFVVLRRTAPDELEILNLAVAPNARRQGVGRVLVAEALRDIRGRCFLEVRESNTAAIALYRSVGFGELAVRPEYYDDPVEAAIVLRFQSC